MYAEGGRGDCGRQYMCAMERKPSQVHARLMRPSEFYVLHLPYPIYVPLHLLVNKYERGGGKRCEGKNVILARMASRMADGRVGACSSSS